MILFRRFMCLSFYIYIFSSYIYAGEVPTQCRWAQTYTCRLTNDEHVMASVQKSYTTRIQDTVPFTQLISSWNADRPTRGYYSFYIQGRDAQTGSWSSWHKAIEWGKDRQRSFLSSSDGIAHYAHVRFEVCSGKKCAAYRLRVKSHDGADLRNFYVLTATCADFTHFVPESAHECISLPTVYVEHVPRRSQFALSHAEKERLCSPTSCAMLVEFITGKRCAMHQFAQHVFDKNLDTYGNWPFNIAHAFELSAGCVGYSVARLNSFRELHAYLMQGTPVVVSVRGPLVGAPKPYANGHLLVVVGYDAKKKKVICHDPAFELDRKTLHQYDLSHFLRAWECSRRLVYRIDKKR